MAYGKVLLGAALCVALAGCGALTHAVIPYEDEAKAARKHRPKTEHLSIQASNADTQTQQFAPTQQSVPTPAVQAKPATQSTPTQPAQPVAVLQVPKHLSQSEQKARNYYQAANQRALVNRDDLLIPPNSHFHTTK